MVQKLRPSNGRVGCLWMIAPLNDMMTGGLDGPVGIYVLASKQTHFPKTGEVSMSRTVIGVGRAIERETLNGWGVRESGRSPDAPSWFW